MDDEDLDALLAVVTLDEIATAWCRYHEAPGTQFEGPDWWAASVFYTTEIFNRPLLYRSLLLKLLEHAASSYVVDAVAAGPLENFVSDDEDDLQWIERECATRPKLRQALLGTASASYVSHETLLRLDAAAQQPLLRPAGRDELRPDIADILYDDALTPLERALRLNDLILRSRQAQDPGTTQP